MPLGHHAVVVAVTLNQRPLRDLVVSGELLQRCDDAGRILSRPGRRRVQIGLVRDGQRIDVVAVSIEKSGKQRLAVKIHDSRGGAFVGLFDALTIADSRDPAVHDSQRFRRRLRVVHRDDVATNIEGLRRVMRFSRSQGRAGDQCCQQH